MILTAATALRTEMSLFAPLLKSDIGRRARIARLSPPQAALPAPASPAAAESAAAPRIGKSAGNDDVKEKAEAVRIECQSVCALAPRCALWVPLRPGSACPPPKGKHLVCTRHMHPPRGCAAS